MPFHRRAIEGQSRARLFREIAERSTHRLAQLSMGDRIAIKYARFWFIYRLLEGTDRGPVFLGETQAPDAAA